MPIPCDVFSQSTLEPQSHGVFLEFGRLRPVIAFTSLGHYSSKRPSETYQLPRHSH